MKLLNFMLGNYLIEYIEYLLILVYIDEKNWVYGSKYISIKKIGNKIIKSKKLSSFKKSGYYRDPLSS